MTEREKSTGAEIITCVILCVAAFLLSPYAMMKLWEWFIAPATGWAEVGYFHAWGIVLFMGYPVAFLNSTAIKRARGAIEIGSSCFAVPLGALVFGFIVKSLM